MDAVSHTRHDLNITDVNISVLRTHHIWLHRQKHRPPLPPNKHTHTHTRTKQEKWGAKRQGTQVIDSQSITQHIQSTSPITCFRSIHAGHRENYRQHQFKTLKEKKEKKNIKQWKVKKWCGLPASNEFLADTWTSHMCVDLERAESPEIKVYRRPQPHLWAEMMKY